MRQQSPKIVEAEAVVENPDPEANQSETDRQAQEDRNALKDDGPANDGAKGVTIYFTNDIHTHVDNDPLEPGR